MLDPNLKEWEVLAWLTSLIAVTFIDAIKEVHRESERDGHFLADPDLEVARERLVSGAQELFDRSADEELYPELKPALAFYRTSVARQRATSANSS